jgi:hypothetical protein
MAVRAALWMGVVAAVLAAPSAWAEDHYTGSPRYGAIELKFGGFKPRIGDTNGLTTDPYRQVFGAGSMTLFTLQYDRYIYQGIGAFGVGFNIGYAEKYGKATNSLTGLPSPVQTALHVAPMNLLALYNFDWLALKYNIPLVPYVKAGLAYVPWWSSAGTGGVEFVDGKRQAGGSFGFVGIGGISFMLDVLEPRLARDFDSSMGVNHTYLFAEFNAMNADSFGNRVDLSSNYWMFGISFEF